MKSETIAYLAVVLMVIALGLTLCRLVICVRGGCVEKHRSTVSVTGRSLP